MAILTTGNTYSAGDQVTPTNLNAIVNSATFNDPADEESIEKVTAEGPLLGKLQIKDGGVTAAKIGSGAVTNAKLGLLSVATANLQTNSVTSIKITDSNVTTTKIAANAVTGAKLNTDAISAQTELTAAPANEDEFLISDAGVIKRIGWDTMLKHAAIPKAYGLVTFDNASFTALAGNYGVASVAGGTDYRAVTLTSAMSSSTYVVQVTIIDDLGAADTWANFEPFVELTGASTFEIWWKENASFAPKIAFTVFGTLA